MKNNKSSCKFNKDMAQNVQKHEKVVLNCNVLLLKLPLQHKTGVNGRPDKHNSTQDAELL